MSESSDKVLTLKDLRSWKRSGGDFAVVGYPVAHSLSPKMHNAALAMAKYEKPELAKCKYYKFEIHPEELGEALGLFYEKKFKGINLTLPHKVIALPFLKETSPMADTVGAANTLCYNEELGGFTGENTDCDGFRLAVKSELGRDLKGENILLLGAGGAARAVAIAALTEVCDSLTIRNRSKERAETLFRELKEDFPLAEISLIPWDVEPKGEFSLIVNATSLGLHEDDPSPFPPKLLRKGMAVFDATYGVHTPALVASAQRKEIPATDGRAMLAWQGALAFEIWTGISAQDVFPVMHEAISK